MQRRIQHQFFLLLLLTQIGWRQLPQQTRIIRACLYENAPKIYTDENGQPAGFWVDLLGYIAKQENWQVEWVPGTWDECLTRLADNEIDIVPDMGWTEQRSQIYAFSEETVLISWTRLYVPTGSSIKSILDLNGKTIAGLRGSFNLDGPEGLRDLIQQFGIHSRIIEMDNYNQVFDALERGEIDAGITNKDFGNLNEKKYNVERTPIIFQPARIQFAFTKDAPLTPYLMQRIDAQMRELKADNNSVYYQALDKYLGTKASGAVEQVIPGWVKNLMLFGGGFVLFLLAVGVVSRIQVQRRTRELQENQVLLQIIANSTTDSIFAKDTQGKYILFNKGAELAVGIKAADAIGRDDYFIFPEQVERIAADDQKIIKSGEVVTYEEIIPNAKNEPRTFLTTKGPIFSNDKSILGLFGIARDITERKRAEEMLKETNDRLINILESMSDGFVAFDAKLNYTYVNTRGGELLGREPQDLIGKNYWTEYPEAKGTPFADAYVRALETQQPVVFENYYAPWDRWFENRIYPLADGISVFFTETTERRQAEDERENLITELTSKNTELEHFIYTISHDLKSPLVTMKGFLGYLERDAVNGNVERLKGDTQRIANAVETMQKLLGDLLELSRIGRFINPPEKIPLEVLVREAAGLVEGQIQKRGVRLDIQPDLPIVYGDKLRLLEVLQNLISNAVTYMGDQADPHIEIGYRIQEIAGIRQQVFFVKDNGIGIAPEHHERIFGLFNKLDAISEGTGVGLALVKRIIELHGGQVWVESELGQGSVFYFTLPKVQ